jgi:DNA-binding response OmpR family regulator
MQGLRLPDSVAWMPPPVIGATIAVVVGDEDLSALIQTVLAGPALHLSLAGTGRAGLNLLRAHPPDVLLLDLSLPDMNGWELFMQLQSEDGTTPMPIIMLADRASRVDKNFGLYVAGVHDFVMKPFMPSQLRASVTRALADGAPMEFLHAVTFTPA